MAISSESSTSPRISFSHDLHKKDDSSQIEFEKYPSDRLDSCLLETNFDFNFCVSENETSSAEELFSDGLIRPLHQLQDLQERFVSSKEKEKEKISHSHSLPPVAVPLPLPSCNENSKLEIMKLISDSDPKSSQSKSFWGFKRSTSLHCENSHKKSSFWSLPLLSRSNSTGSVSNSKRSNSQSSFKDCHQKQNLNKPKNFGLYAYPMSHKPPLKKNFGGYNGNNGGVRISPVLNVPPPYISRGTANLFGLGSLFGNGKDRKNKK